MKWWCLIKCGSINYLMQQEHYDSYEDFVYRVNRYFVDKDTPVDSFTFFNAEEV